MEPSNDIILVSTLDTGIRGERLSRINVQEFSQNVYLFLNQMEQVLDKTPQKVGAFHIAEFEVTVEVTAKGTLAILGVGGEAGATGGLKFVFRRT